MKLIVDEMPKDATDCIFAGYMVYECKLTGAHCGLYDGRCSKLKPVTECYAEDIVGRNDDGTYYSRNIPIKV